VVKISNTGLEIYGILYFNGMISRRFGPTKRHDPRSGVWCVLHFNGMFGILYFDGMPRFILTFGTAKPTNIVGLVPPNVLITRWDCMGHIAF